MLLLTIAVRPATAQVHTLVTELQQFSLAQLPHYRTRTVEKQQSTYDLKGGNDDGFIGTYSFVKRNADSSLVMLDIDGPGILNRIATPTPSKDTLDFYIDETSKPTFSVAYQDLFNGKKYPFIQPLCDSAVGGYYCYLPIPFQKHLKIVYRGHQLQFHQLGYRLYPKDTAVKSFHLPLSDTEQKALAGINDNFKHPEKQVSGNEISKAWRILPGQSQSIRLAAGRINSIRLDTANGKNLRLKITWDNEKVPAIDCSLPELFGYAFGRPAMHALPVGQQGSNYYGYFPMPFDDQAIITLTNTGTATVRTSLSIRYSPEKRHAVSEGKFYVQTKNNKLTQQDPFHVFLDIKGKGHYVGTTLTGTAYYNGLTGFWEGDDTTSVDHQPTMHGTGTEDYFNGGWYDVKGKWEHQESRPLSGCLGYGRTPAHTGGYRFFLTDKLSFEQSFYHAIEHGGSPQGGIPADYHSTSYYYCDRDKERQNDAK